MDLEISALTRRDRLERIAAAERDRRAGLRDLALATLGEASEWPARIVLALVHLAEAPDGQARAILEGTLDDWAAQSGLAALAEPTESENQDSTAAGPAIEAEVADAETDVVAVEAFDDPLGDPFEVPFAAAEDAEAQRDTELLSDLGAEALNGPIEPDEFERAFASAEVQVDEMHDVNSVAERVLMNDAVGLAELSGDAFAGIDGDPEREDSIETVEPFADAEEHEDLPEAQLDAAIAEAPEWPAPPSSFEGNGALGRFDVVGTLDAVGTRDAVGAGDPDADSRDPGRVLSTLERWLGNLENNRTGRAQ